MWSSNQSFVEPIALKSLILSHNNLSGEFPRRLEYFNSLILLNLENNNFVGSVPPWIRKKLPSLRFLLLGSNRFNGAIPGQLFKLELLQLLDLSNNNLNGTVPSSLRSLQALTTLRDDTFASHNPFSIDIGINPLTDEVEIVTEVDTKGQLLDFEDNILYYKSLDLSQNNLVGNIPEEIGALVGLRNLNLSRNKLSGDIPRSVGNLESLESLDLSNNDLSGSIPLSLSDLTFLSHLNLSYNNLFGRIPSGRQLQALDDPSIYEGNNGLCGFPLPIECPESKTTSQYFISEKENSHDVNIGVVIGFAFGAWIVYGALLFKRSWRVAYLSFVDNMYDRFYVFVILNWARIMQK